MRRRKIETAIGAAGEPRDLTKCLLGDRIAALVEHEGRDAPQPQFPRHRRKVIDSLFHRIADVHQRRHLGAVGFGTRMLEHFADLRMPANAWYPPQQIAEPGAVGYPARGAAFVQPAEVDELHVEAADRTGFTEHLALQLASRVPGWLAAHRGIKGKDQPPALAGFGRWRERMGALNERVDLRALGFLCRLSARVRGSRRRLVVICHGLEGDYTPR